MTGDSEQDEQAAELARQVEAAREQGMPIFRVVQDFIAGEEAAGPVLAVARQVAEAMDLGIAEVIAVVRKLGGLPQSQDGAVISGEGTLVAGRPVLAGAGLTAEARIVAIADVAAASESLSVVRLEDIGKLSARVSQSGISGLSAMQVLTLVLVWLLTLGVPVVEQLALPPEARTVISNEYATISIGLAITLWILQKRKR